MRRVSAFIEVLAGVITDDLKNHVAPDKLAYEVEREIEKQLLSQMVQAVSKYSQCTLYSPNGEVERNQRKNEMLRHMGYVQELFTKVDEVKGILAAGGVTEEAIFEVVS